MDFITHIMVGFLVCTQIPAYCRPIFLFCAALMAGLPDFDVFLEPLRRKYQSYYLSHRAGTHSFITAIPFALILSGIFFSFQPYPFGHFFLFCYGFYCLHLLLDLLTLTKIPFLYPLSKIEVRLKCERSVNFYLMLFSSISVLIMFFTLLFVENLHISLIIAQILIGIYILYFLHRIILRFYLLIRSPKNEKYIPDFFPFSSGLYSHTIENSHHKFTLTPKPFFSITQIPKISIILDEHSDDFQKYHEMLHIAQGYRFFRKSTGIFPIIWEERDRCVGVLFLAEYLTKTYGYHMKAVFKPDTNKIQSINDGFNIFEAISPELRQKLESEEEIELNGKNKSEENIIDL